MRKIAPSERKKQELEGLLRGESPELNGEGVLSRFIKLSVEQRLQELLELDQAAFLGRERYRRRQQEEEEDQGGVYRNGYEPGRFKTAEGVMEVSKPQVRGLEEPYRSSLWERVRGTSEQLKELVIEMYTRGMSTRDVESALERALGGFVLSRNSVSTMTEELLEEYERFRNRDLSDYEVAYLFVDTVYEPLRRYGSSTGVLCCWGYLADGSKILIDLTLSNRESEAACLDFLRGLVNRGLRPPLTVTSDGAPGLIRAIDQVWPESLRIRCWAHKMRNLQAKIPDSEWARIKGQLMEIRDAASVEQAREKVDSFVDEHESEFPEACRCLLDDVKASLRHLRVPLRHRSYVRTTNLIERTFVEQRRRTKVIPHFWDQKDLTKLVFGVLIRVSDRWGRPQFSQFEQRQLRLLRAELLGENIETPTQRVAGRRSAKRVA